jgi:hypothetical protein
LGRSRIRPTALAAYRNPGSHYRPAGQAGVLGIIGRGFADNNRPTRLAAEARPLLDDNLLATWRPKE